ncbi:MAG TPA: choice-of-anchor J domain-containing protein [Longilinea sp.]|nr:choice-of-anchor J domain-containing protein [Longilinea sp.]
MQKRPNWFLIGGLIFGLGVCCLVAVSVFVLVPRIFSGYDVTIDLWGTGDDQASDGSPSVAVNTDPNSTVKPTPTANAVPESDLTAAYEALNSLENSIPLINDVRLLPSQLTGSDPYPFTVNETPRVYNIGDSEVFWAGSTDSSDYFQVTAILRAKTEHAYFWVEQGVQVDTTAMQELATTFEDEIYPLDRDLFGDEWTPGIDNDEHLYILFFNNIGEETAGYFASENSYVQELYSYSNEHEMFFMASTPGFESDLYMYGVLAHEFQHMIHWYRDQNEELWLNEGAGDLGTFLAGYDEGGFDSDFLRNTDLQLTDWEAGGDTSPHYGASFLFMLYFYDRFGDEATRALVASQQNGMVSIDSILAEMNINNPNTGETMTADDVFADWTVTNYLGDSTLADGIYYYPNYTGVPHASLTESITSCPSGDLDRTVSQYGTDYIRLACSGTYNLVFDGNTEASLFNTAAHSGSYAFWSNKGDESQMTLTRSFDLGSVSGPVSMSYWTWYNVEEGYDYVYLLASRDGTNWSMLTPPGCTWDNSTEMNLGCSYNGRSSGWIQETVDLSTYAGGTVYIRFIYVTDMSINGAGFLLDDISIPAINYSTDFEVDDGGWEAEGFARVNGYTVPQTYQVILIRQGQPNEVQYITLDANQNATVPITFDDRTVILAVSATARYTSVPAGYTFRLEP